jgi:hypothetical protein
MNGRYHSREFKIELVKQVESGETTGSNLPGA